MHLSVSCIFSVCRSKIDPKPELFAVAKRRDGVALNLESNLGRRDGVALNLESNFGRRDGVALNLDTRVGFGALSDDSFRTRVGWWFPS